jgi:hypothetical protein
MELLESRCLLSAGAFLQGFAFADPGGVFHSGSGLGGATIALYASDGTTLLAQTTTSADGYYRFDDSNVPQSNGHAGLNPGAYFLVESTAPAGYVGAGTQIFSQLDPAAADVVLAGQHAIKTTIVDPSQLQATFDQFGLGVTDNPTFFGSPDPGFTGELDIHLTDLANPAYRSPAAGSFISYCVNLDQSVSLGVTFPTLPEPAVGALPNGPEIAYLFNEYGTTGALNPTNLPFGKPTDNEQAEALQQAIWKLEYGSNFTPDFHGAAEVENAYNFYLADAAGRDEAAVVLDASLGGQAGVPPPNGGQSMLATATYNFNNVKQARPAIVTNAMPAGGVVGTVTLKDSATLSGGVNETGTITFTLFAPNGVTVVDTETVAVNGNGTYVTPIGYVPTTPGTYNWVAAYSGDANNLPVSSHFGDEPVTVTQAHPSILTNTAPPSGLVGVVTLKDSATLSGGINETGTITFTLVAPNNTVVDTETVAVNGNGTYVTPVGYVPTTAGTYNWVAAYSGDANNAAVSSNFGDEPAIVTPARPGIVTNTTPTSGLVGIVTLKDSATLSGGFNETGTITFKLFAPDGITVVDTETVAVGGNGIYVTPVGFVPTTAGTYNWVAAYSGDANNAAVTSNFGDEPVTVTPAHPTIVTNASPSGGVVGAVTLKDSATLSGGFHETGTITFKLYAPDAVTVVDTETVAVTGNGTYVTPAGFVPTTPGTYNWVAAYSGDPNNAAIASRFGDEPAIVTLGGGQISKRFLLSSSNSQFVLAGPAALAAGAFQSYAAGSIASVLPTFTWTPLVWADHYDLWVDDTSTGQAQVIREPNVLGTTFTALTPLTVGHSYQWWVRGVAADGTVSLWSYAESFKIFPLAAPTLAGPAGEVNNMLPTFAWQAVGGADHYDLWVDDATTGQSQVIRRQALLGTSFTSAIPLVVGHSYQWWVRAVTNTGAAGAWSDTSRFTEVVVGTPVPIGPHSSGAANATFSWRAAVGADHYDLWLDDLSTGQSQVVRNQHIATTSFQPPAALRLGDSYRWWVRAITATGVLGAWSPAVDFTAMAFPAPSMLAAAGPAATPTFSWAAVSNADHYDVWVDDVTTGQAQVIRAKNVIGTSLAGSPLTQGHVYRWWVQAVDATGKTSPWSDPLTFTL